MSHTNLQHIKRSQKESLLLREISQMLHQITLDDSSLLGLSINRVELSQDKSTCIVFFYDPAGIEDFHEKMGSLILYKPSLRKGIATALNSRYVPNIKFAYDTKFEQQQRIESILEDVKKDLDKE